MQNTTQSQPSLEVRIEFKPELNTPAQHWPSVSRVGFSRKHGQIWCQLDTGVIVSYGRDIIEKYTVNDLRNDNMIDFTDEFDNRRHISSIDWFKVVARV